MVLGGTFDKIHKGHQALLMKAFEVGNHVLIGLCTDEFVRKRDKIRSSYKERLNELEFFLGKQGVLDRAEIFPLHDLYGPAASSERIDAIVVSEETEQGAREINLKREDEGLPPLKVVVVKMIPSEDGIPISTTRILKKEVNREGRLLKPKNC